MTADDYFKIQQQNEFIRKLDERIENGLMILHLLDEKIEALKNMTVSIDYKVVKPIKISDLITK